MKTHRFPLTSTLKIILAVGFSAIAAAQTLRAATVTTSKADYQPGETAKITGAGFGTNDTVTVRVLHADGTPSTGEDHEPWVVNADENGGFTTTWYVCTDDCVGSILVVTATGSPSGLTASATFTDAAANPGVAPVSPPCGGFAIDGDLFANMPTAFSTNGDWISTNSPGCGVLNTNGSPINSTNTYHFFDAWNSGSDDGFVSGPKVNDHPTNWVWALGQVGNKVDINNALIHITKDSSNHTWIVVSGDRLDNSGDAYIDFEFMQNELTVVTNGAGTGGTFATAGTNCGRTTNDFLVTVSLTKGGKNAGFFISRWQTNTAEAHPNGCGTAHPFFDYFDVTTNVPTSSYFAAVNTNTIYVPYTAFGITTYDVNTFAEAAVDLTAILGSFNECLTLGIKTILIKTKVSASDDASVVDFIAPLQIRPPLVIGPAALAGPDQTNCTQGATTTFTMNASVQPGTNPLNGTNWTVVSGSASIANSNSLTTTVTLTGAVATATLRLTVTDSGACTNNFTSDDVILTVKPLPSCEFSSSSAGVDNTNHTVIQGGRYVFTGPAGVDSYSWSITSQGTPAVILGPANKQSVTNDLPVSGLVSFTLTLATTKDGCTNICSQTYGVQPGALAGCVITGVTPVCPSTSQNHTNNTDVPPGQPVNSYSWILTNNTSGATFVGATNTDTVTVNAGTNCGSYTVQSMVNYGNNKPDLVCGFTVNVQATLAITCPSNITVQCLTDVPVCPGSLAAFRALGGTATNSCTTNLTYLCTDGPLVGGICGGTITRTHTVSDACTNASCVQIITVRDTIPPVLVGVPVSTNVQCLADLPALPTVTATDNCETNLTVTRVSTTNGTCPIIIVHTWSAADACTNRVSASITNIVSDTIPPVLVGVPVGTNVQCLADLPALPTVTATDNCETNLTVTRVSTTNGTCPIIIVHTWSAADACTNRVSASITNIVSDTIPPVLVGVPVGTNVQCLADLPALPTVTATDNCETNLTVTRVSTTNGTCPIIIVHTWSAADACTNRVSASITNIVSDTIPPVLVGVPVGTNVQCLADLPALPTVTATDNCETNLTVTRVSTTNGTCPIIIVHTWSAADACTNRVSASITNRVLDTIRPVLTNLPPATTNYQCYADVPAPPNVTANDNCDGTVTVYYNETQSNPGSSCTNTIRRCWTAYDSCHNTNKFTQTITVNDTTAPVITCATNIIMNCGTCTADPEVTGKATATNATCSGSLVYDGTNAPSAGKITYQDSAADTNSCGWTITRTWTATDLCGNKSTCLQTITCIPSTSEIIVTDSSLCTYDIDPSTDCKDFRLLFTQDPQNFPCYKLTASNPGQTYFNLYYIGTPGQTGVMFNITIPYPYVTQGAQPIHAYDNVTFSGTALRRCLTPGNAIPITSITPSNIVTLANHPGGSNAIVKVTLDVPASGFVYLNVHLDFGLKKTSGFGKGTDDNATSCTSTNILIPNRNNYLFSVSGATSGGDSICNINVFKKLPGVGGLAGTKYTTFDGVSGSIPKQGCTALLKDAKNVVLATGITDSDGWYFCSYKWTGKATTLYLTLTPPGGTPITKTISLKSNGYAQADFDVP